MLDEVPGDAAEGLAERVDIVAVSVDPVEELQQMVERILEVQGGDPPGYRFVSDPGAAVISRYGILNPGGFRGQDISHPTTLVIDTAGVVRWKVVETDYRLRPTNADIAAAVAAVDAGDEPEPATAVPIEPARSGG